MATDPMAHERMRFESMNYRQLCTRLKRITRPEKLLNFSKMAQEYGFDALQSGALEKYARLTGTDFSVAYRRAKIEYYAKARPKPHAAACTPVKERQEIETSIFGKYLLM